jgi:hypothetical protein
MFGSVNEELDDLKRYIAVKASYMPKFGYVGMVFFEGFVNV